jgi:hypothetical protein
MLPELAQTLDYESESKIDRAVAHSKPLMTKGRQCARAFLRGRARVVGAKLLATTSC